MNHLLFLTGLTSSPYILVAAVKASHGRRASNGVSTHIITVHNRSSARRAMKLRKKLAKPTGLGHTVSNCAVLGLGAGPGHGVLALRQPGDQVGTKEDTES